MLQRNACLSLSILFLLTAPIHTDTVQQQKKPSILLVHLAPTWGGISQYITKLYKSLVADDFQVSVLIKKPSKIYDEFERQELPCYAFSKGKGDFSDALLKKLCTICSEKKIDIIHFNYPPATYTIAPTIKHLFGVTTLFTWHSPAIPGKEIIRSFDYVSAVSKDVVEQIEIMNRSQRLKIKKIWHTPPCTDNERFLSYVPTQTRADFFQNSFGVITDALPVVSMIASLTEFKNHQCLIHAFSHLVHGLKTPAHLMIVGQGSLETQLKKLTAQLNLQKYVHFLGFSKEVPDIYYHSDIKVLSSKGESFGAVIVEAALMKKPIIISDHIAAANYIIFDKKTGLLFKDNDPIDLALKIKYLIDHKESASTLGLEACNFVKEHFSSTAMIDRIKNVYVEIFNRK